MHRPGHALTCCNLVPHSSTSLEQPDPLNSHTWTFWSFWTHLVHQIAPSAFKMKKGGGHIFQLSLICTLKAIEVIKKVKKRKKDWVTELWQINTLWSTALTVSILCIQGQEKLSLHWPVPSFRKIVCFYYAAVRSKYHLRGSVADYPAVGLNSAAMPRGETPAH